ncbi:MAG: ectoine/hydroxyectoine ABC transporter permease subunit EhuD [Actinobacteria bacterium]|nr:ectoine/hydroxyectoine ABC transporter permease subunit EhuD [Actinomycetota bacterium]
MRVIFAQVSDGWQWDMEYALEILPAIARGLWQTVQATIIGITIGMLLGLVLALLRRSPSRVVSWPTAAVIEFVRGTPLLVQLFFIFFVLPNFGLTLSPFVTLVVGLGLHYGTYTSESYRAGIDNVERGQWEASTALNLPSTTTWTRVILPQAIPTVIPALGNYLVAMFKDAPLGMGVAAGGILLAAQSAASRSFQPVEPYTVMGLLFLVVSIPAALFVRYLEKRYGYQRG